VNSQSRRVFRLGLYLGRHAGGGGGIGLYSAEILKHYLALLEKREPSLPEIELFVYAPTSFLDSRDFLTSSHLRWRALPERFGRKLGLLVDLFLVGLLAKRDRVELLHSTSNYACLGLGISQLITVHDLYQAWPPAGSKGLGFTSWFYKLLFRFQFPRVKHVVSDAASIASEVRERFRRTAQNTSVIPLGIESELQNYLLVPDTAAESWLKEKGLTAGYALLFAAADPRKNFRRSLQAWRSLPEHLRAQGLAVKLNEPEAELILRSELSEDELRKSVRILPWLTRIELFRLYRGASVSLVPSIAEGFGFPALESVSLGCPVVSPELDCLRSIASDKVFFCNPLETDSIGRALAMAMEFGLRRDRVSAGSTAIHSMEQAALDTLRLSCELMGGTI